MPTGVRRTDDRGSIVLGWLGRLTLTIALLGVVGFEVLSVVVGKVQIQDIGQTASQDAITAFQETNSTETAYQAASAYAESEGATIPRKSFEINSEAVTFDLKKVAPTLFLYRWDKSAGWAELTTTIYAEPIEAGGSLS